MMSSEEETAPLPHPEIQDKSVRRHRIPRHLEDYLLAYNPRRSALSSPTTEMEQRGAAAAADISQADAASHLDGRAASHNPSSGDILNTTSLSKLIESISRNESEENAEVAQLTIRLRQYERRHRRRQELLKHISSFLMEEEADEDHHNRKDATPSSTRSPSVLRPHTSLISPNHSPSSLVDQNTESGAHHMEPQAGGYITACVSGGQESETKVRDYTPITGSERASSAFTPINLASSKCPGSPHITISSGMVTPTLGLQQPIQPDPLLLQATGLTHRYDSSGQGLRPQVHQQVTATAHTYEPKAVSYSYPPASQYHQPQVTQHGDNDIISRNHEITVHKKEEKSMAVQYVPQM